jgi:multiple antibiotic resistance protein
MELLKSLPQTVQTLLMTVLGLLIVLNPSGLSSVFLSLTRGLDRAERRWIALRAVIVGGLVLTLFAVTGTLIFELTRITGAGLQIAGGIFIFGLAFALARGKEHEFFGHLDNADSRASAKSIAYTPLAIPMIAGPASITVVVTASAKASNDPYARAALLVSIGLACVYCLLSMWRWVARVEKWGPGITQVAPRIMALVLAVIAVQFIIDGIEQVLPRLARAWASGLPDAGG